MNPSSALDEQADGLLSSAPPSFLAGEHGGKSEGKESQMETLLYVQSPALDNSGDEATEKFSDERQLLELGQGLSVESLEEQEAIAGMFYCSHFLARWGHSMWDFAAALFMIYILPESLVLGAIYGFVEAAAVVTLGVFVGNWVDQTAHLKVLQISLVIGNGSIMAAGIGVILLLLHTGLQSTSFPAFVALVSCVDILGGLSKLGLLATDIVVERDWVVVISEQYGDHGSMLLSRMNAVMCRIDLFCQLLAPVAVGFLLSSVSVTTTAIVITVWNMLSIGFQYYLLSRVYWRTPALQARNPSPQTKQGKALVEINPMEGEQTTKYSRLQVESPDEGLENVEVVEETASGSCRPECLLSKASELSFVKGWHSYWKQEVVLAAVALAFLYFTVLSFGPLMTAVLQLKGVPPYVLGLARGVAALVGIAGTVAYPPVHAQLKTERTGLWAIWIQWSFLSICVASIWVSSSTVSAAMLMGGVCASRLGLWMFDLAVTQLMQEFVHELERGAVGGFQSSLQSFMELITYLVTIFISRPQDFWILICLSYLAVTAAATLFAVHTHRVRGHLVHVERLAWLLTSCKDMIGSIFNRWR